MAYMPYPLQPPNFLVATTSQRSQHPPAISETMYGGRSPTAEEPDNVILHEPWEMPPNAAPNHCAPGCSILLNSEESGRGRRFSILGKRRNSRSGSFTSARRSVSEGLSGGKLGHLFDSNPFSFDSAPTKAADIKPEGSAEEKSGRGTPSSQMEAKRECSLRFGELPHRPPELRRASSVSIGVLSRKALLSEQNGPGTPPRQNPNIRPVIHSTEPEPIDVGEVVKSGAKHLWQNLRSSFSGASGSSHEAPVNTRASFSAYIDSSRRASASSSNPSSPSVRPHLPSPLASPSVHPHHASPLHSSTSSDSIPPTLLSDDFADYSLGASSLAAVKEEPGSGTATPRLGRDGSSLGLDKLRLGPEGETALAEAAPDVRDRAKSPLSSDISEAIPQLSPTLKHPDPTRRPPSPPPRPSDLEGLGVEDEDEEGEAEDGEEAYGTPPEAVVQDPLARPRRASHGADGRDGGGREVHADRAERESRGETKEAAILGFQR